MLTDVQCKTASCPAEKSRTRLADAGGLYLEVTPKGSKRWFLKYRIGGKEKRLALGSYPAVGLTAARRARDVAKLQKADGVDPVQARKVKKLGNLCKTSFFEISSQQNQALTRNLRRNSGVLQTLPSCRKSGRRYLQGGGAGVV